MLVARPDYSPGTAARECGYSNPWQYSKQLLSMPKIQKQLVLERRKYEKQALVSRAEIIDTFRDAIEMARMKADPGVMIKGAAELGHMCGYYQEGDTKLTVSPTGEIVLEQVRRMTDDELLILAAEAEADEARTIDGELDSENSLTRTDMLRVHPHPLEGQALENDIDAEMEALSVPLPLVGHAEDTASGIDLAQSEHLQRNTDQRNRG